MKFQLFPNATNPDLLVVTRTEVDRLLGRPYAFDVDDDDRVVAALRMSGAPAALLDNPRTYGFLAPKAWGLAAKPGAELQFMATQLHGT